MPPPLAGRTIRAIGDYENDYQDEMYRRPGGQNQGGTPYQTVPATPRPGVVQNNVYGRPTVGEQRTWFGGGSPGPDWGNTVNDRIPRDPAGGLQRDQGMAGNPWGMTGAPWSDPTWEGGYKKQPMRLGYGGPDGQLIQNVNRFGMTPGMSPAVMITGNGGAGQWSPYASAQQGVPMLAAQSPQATGGGPPLAAPGAAPAPGGERPWWMNYDLGELGALPPQMLAQLPPEVLSAFSNEVYTNNPSLLERLSPADIQARGFAPGFLQGLQGGAPGTYAPGNFIPTLEQAGNAGLVVGPNAAATAQYGPGGWQPGLSPYRNRFMGGVHPPSQWTLNGMTGTDREALGGLMGLTGNEFAWQDYLGRMQR